MIDILIKNKEYIIEITGYTGEGEGVGRADGEAVFVPSAIMGEKLKVLIVKPLKHYAYGKIIEIITPSAHRVEPECIYYKKCGGCVLQHMDYSAQLEFKRIRVQDALKRLGGCDTSVEPVTPSPDIFRYRNKAQLPVSDAGIGFYEMRSHNVIDINDCLIQNEVTAKIIKVVRDYMDKYNIPAYNEEKHNGIIRGIFIRNGSNTGEIMTCIITRTKDLPYKEELVESLSKIENMTSIFHNINREKTNVQMGKTNYLLWGSETIKETLCGVEFHISPLSFFQINTKQTEQLYAKAAEFAKVDNPQTVFDLYCGTGTISLITAQNVKKVVGVEIVPSAVENAKKNAERNGIDNVEFFLGKSEALLPQLAKDFSPDTVILDPPRKGCDINLIDSLNKVKPNHIVYVSCDPSTLARDIKNLQGYQVEKVVPFDMFPHTKHVECVVLMSRIKD
ncbi:MAG: 23S rRNA (uracil(1939)-C(5))-methyltransferase RlmD [Eubacteriales bacterium]|nr:23S rRNA (uracil(1939)-C(5))-methyltransferase RlmD [Eubacteriales bacterium]